MPEESGFKIHSFSSSSSEKPLLKKERESEGIKDRDIIEIWVRHTSTNIYEERTDQRLKVDE